jgi:predicted lipoprotein with Yx(FWY)xxD motif
LDGEAGSGGVGGSAGGAAGSAGAPAVTYDVGVKLNQALGEHLITKLGLTLYTYASDLPGDCSNAPVTNCTKDCLKAWPVFDAGLRSLDPKLSDAGFGRFLRPDGVYQTTYYGWPLYTYVDKAGLPDVGISGQSKSWNVAETATPTVVIMKQAVKDGIRYLADYRGRTLYTFDKDTVGTADAYPVSACSGSCSAKYPALMDRSFSTVPSLEPTDFGMFVREGGGLQISYKGAPLYYSVADQKPGTMDGAADGFAVVKIQ